MVLADVLFGWVWRLNSTKLARILKFLKVPLIRNRGELAKGAEKWVAL